MISSNIHWHLQTGSLLPIVPWRKQKALVIVPMAQIYEIADNKYNKFYIGSGCEPFLKRMGRHKREYNPYLLDEQNKHFPRPVLLFDEFGIDNCDLELVEKHPTSSRK